MSTDEQITYTTKNCASFLRGHESIVLRLANQQQYEMILSMNEKKLPSLLKFECVIEYLTLANQRIKYASLYELLGYMFPCTNATSTSIYWGGKSSSGGYILINPQG